MDKIDVTGFFLLGIATRTTNQDGQAAKDIGDLWCRFMDDNVLLQIEDRISDEVHCIYTDYETDHTGPYTAILGCKVNSLDHIPEGLVGLTVAPGTYVRFTANSWMPDRVAETWQYIWNSSLNRKYTADFDVYGCNSCNSDDTRVEIYVAVK
ncbi:AraC family transcriptional regulator [Mucilaginibacter sp. HC2]|uniref:GyrI-like domain-containing protein n=1 Tax=Mucilaginibacter inviolabilis TaxID=2714892 RepID=UPI00140A65FB|nr:GyrI-like domain-containing protein [Mucilaginibacter inviolabilis]NHA04037.1 AraC family transcriptional regulator [Mucilaginibacter inviolabilis]